MSKTVQDDWKLFLKCREARKNDEVKGDSITGFDIVIDCNNEEIKLRGGMALTDENLSSGKFFIRKPSKATNLASDIQKKYLDNPPK